MAERDLTQGPVWRALAAVSAPMTLGIFAVLSAGLVDAYFLGRVSPQALAAVGFVYPSTTVIVSLSIGLSAGANAAISQAIGRGTASADVTRLSLHAIGLGLVLALLTAALFYLGYAQYFALIGAGPGVMEEISAYTPLWTASFPFLVMLMVTNSVFRAHGDAAMASVFMLAQSLINIGLNPVLIFGWGPIEGMGTAGAGLAVLIARVAAMLAALAYAWRKGYLSGCGALLHRLAGNLRDIVHVGAPAAFSNAINPAGMALVISAVATLGDVAVAGFGAATRIQAVVIVPLMALSAGLSPMVGQNWGAERQDRARTALMQAWAACLAYGALLAVALLAFADTIALAIASDQAAADYAATYLRVVGGSLFGYGILVTANAAMNARSKPLYAMILGIARTFAIYLPAAWIGVLSFGYPGILAAAIAANLLGVAGALYFAARADLLPPSTAKSCPVRLLDTMARGAPTR